MTERFEATTTVRRPRVVLMWTVMGLMIAFFAVATLLRAHFGKQWAPLLQLPWWTFGPVIAAIQRRPKIETLRVQASSEGIRVGEKLVPRAKLKSALLRREGDRTFVLLRGASSTAATIDVQVSGDEEADRLCGALALDAKSTTAEFQLFRASRVNAAWLFAVVGAMTAVLGLCGAMLALKSSLFPIVAVAGLLGALVVGLPLLILAQRMKLLVGADGLVIKEGLGKRRFVSHDEIERVEAVGKEVVLSRKRGEAIKLAVGNTNARKKQKQATELHQQAESIAWRIEKAREAYRALAGEAPQAALALDRGSKTTREWIDQLRRIGEGANATFRSVGLTREQLLRVVESTSASARERLAAAVALRGGLTEEEKPRIRVAAERCVQPALGERMVRVAFAPDEELASALDEAEEISAGADAR